MTVLEAPVRERIGAAAEWRLLSLLLSRPRAGWYEEVVELSREVSDPRLRDAALAARGATEGAYHALLGPGGRASLREAAYAGFGDPGRILADLTERYGAFGFTPRAEEADDHLAVECGFVSYLFLKEAYALLRGEDDAAAVTREQRARFLAEHAAIAGCRIVERLPAGAPGYLLATAECLAARLPAVPPASEAAPEQLDPLGGGCPATCGPCPES